MSNLFWMFMVLIPIVVSLSLTYPKGETEDASPHSLSNFRLLLDASVTDQGLQYEFYHDKCPKAETIVRNVTAQIVAQNGNATAQILRLLFHDCFIQGCDASVLLDNDGSNNTPEKKAVPNLTLKGFDFIAKIKEELEKECPGVVSCADILVLGTRDAIALAGGPFYPLFTGRRDSNTSYYALAMVEIPKPDINVSETLRLFSLRGFSERETVSLLGAHNIGKIGCDSIRIRLHNFHQTGQSDLSIPTDFLSVMIKACEDGNNSSSMSSGSKFDNHYYERLLEGRGLLFADQQLMANEKTAELVRAYASDDGTTFRVDFVRAMLKMSNLGVLTGTQGQVRLNCSRLVN